VAQPIARKRSIRPKQTKSRRWPLLLLLGSFAVFISFYILIAVCLIGLRFINPPTTSVQIERRIESWFAPGAYQKHYSFVPLSRISLDLQHAVISAEDARFFQHHGFDWNQIELAANEDVEGKRLRGASTIDQQLVKNLFLTTSRSIIRKAIEATIVPLAEIFLGKRRILELYLNVVEWGPGVYGAQAAAAYHYHVTAAQINREQGARLAAILPAPRRRKPAAMSNYASRILARMHQVDW
jgi:monofunctional biosynthetic peptidoglycan transglycosylase